jgi:glucose/arabinose dehydrogenase
MRSARSKLRMAAILAGMAAILVLPARAGAAVALQPVGSFSSPIYVTSPPGDPRLFVVERAGRIQVMHDGVTSQFLDISGLVDSSNGERGLLSMAFDPNYASNGLFYVLFNDNGSAGATQGDIHVDEFHVTSNPNVADSTSRRPVLTISHSSSANHNGGQLQFGPDGLLYVSVGDATTSANAQTLTNLLGKVLRIDPHGATPGAHTSPGSNPFVGVGGAQPEIWSLGLRNPWRFSFDHLTGDLLIGDVGEGSREEVDDSPLFAGLGAGANYGWPNCEGLDVGGGCSNPAYTRPIFAYPHSNPGGGAAFGCAIVGGYVYRGNRVPELAGRYVYMDLCTRVLRSFVPGFPLAADDRSEGVSIGNTPYAFGEDANCNLYLAQGSPGNTVYRLDSTSPPAAAPSCNVPQAPAGTPAAPVCKRHKTHKKHRSAEAAKKKKKHKKKGCKTKKKKKGKKHVRAVR